MLTVIAAALCLANVDTAPDADWVRTQHHIELHGQALKYTATAGTISIKTESNEEEAKMFFVAYTEDGANTSTRPIVFGFNGGPGSASLWLHMGTMGPRRAALNDDGSMPAPPFHLVDNQETWLGSADIVMIDAVGTGYSRLTKADAGKRIYSVRGDAQAFAEFIRSYLGAEKRWLSPLYIAGESYGGMRSGVLSNTLLQNGIALNGIVYISGTLNDATLSNYKGNDLPYELFLPSFAAVAYYHHKLSDRLQKDLAVTVHEVQDWAIGDYARALQLGSALPQAEFNKVAQKLSEYTGLPKSYCELANLRIQDGHFFKELMRSEGKIVGRLDGRFVGRDSDLVGGTAESDPADSEISPTIVACFNDYLARELKYTSELRYEPFGNNVGPWEFGDGAPADTSDDLRAAMTQNRHMKLMCAFGYFDMACPFMGTVYSLNHMGLAASDMSRIRYCFYSAGHMMYIDRASREKMAADVAQFIKDTSPGSN